MSETPAPLPQSDYFNEPKRKLAEKLLWEKIEGLTKRTGFPPTPAEYWALHDEACEEIGYVDVRAKYVNRRAIEKLYGTPRCGQKRRGREEK
jgi:hypothetical protein